MLSVSVHKDIGEYTEKVVGKLSARTLACTAGGIASAVAVGDYPDLSAAAAAMCRISEAVNPRPEYREVYDRKYALYRKTIECLDPLWSEMQSVIDASGKTAD